ncbi:hypothetical protein CEXT_394771 [Caerostris extrusa]|uniref:Uncharacterized protein n=1 Tax=Caerostris extrusa TaxID=172846 RepID=A0AAV4XAF6_CAEEX|nr:hypothetical protein CEXT_394771 [Caerostris extrusa]
MDTREKRERRTQNKSKHRHLSKVALPSEATFSACVPEPREPICPPSDLFGKSPFQMVVLRGGWGIMRGMVWGVCVFCLRLPGDVLMCGILCMANARRKTSWLFSSLPPVCVVFIEEIGDPIQCLD